AEFADVRAELRREIVESAAETRRHFDVVAESLRSTIQVIAEGVLTVDRKLDRFADEVRDEFRKVDRRFLKIEARLGMAPAGPHRCSAASGQELDVQLAALLLEPISLQPDLGVTHGRASPEIELPHVFEAGQHGSVVDALLERDGLVGTQRLIREKRVAG